METINIQGGPTVTDFTMQLFSRPTESLNHTTAPLGVRIELDNN